MTNGQIASATTDMGHQGQNDGSWAANNPQAVIDFAYRAEHVTAQTAKAVITKFYGKRPAYSYFDGCSDGGREALMEAQRYPDDFDGIAAGAAGAPAQDMDVQNIFHHAWNVLTNLDSNGKYILLAYKLPLIHNAVLAACDGIDGLKDGQITHPRLCHFNPYSLVCKAGQAASTCLTTAEAGVGWRLHNAPSRPTGSGSNRRSRTNGVPTSTGRCSSRPRRARPSAASSSRWRTPGTSATPTSSTRTGSSPISS